MTEVEIEVIAIENSKEKENYEDSKTSGNGTSFSSLAEDEKKKSQDKTESKEILIWKNGTVQESTKQNEVDKQQCAMPDCGTVSKSSPVQGGGEWSNMEEDDDIVALEEFNVSTANADQKLSYLNEFLNGKSEECDSKAMETTNICLNISLSDRNDSSIEKSNEISEKPLKRKSVCLGEEFVTIGNEETCNCDSTQKTKDNLVCENSGQLKLVDYQVQCVNLHCQSGYGLAEAPVFVLTYFGENRRKNVLQKVCKDCFELAFRHQQDLIYRLKSHMPILKADFPRLKDDVVVMDPVEEIYEEEMLPEEVIEQIRTYLPEVMEEAVQKYDLEFQMDQANHILRDKFQELEVNNKLINDELNALEKTLKEARILMYKDFTPKTKVLPSLNIIEPDEIPELTSLTQTDTIVEKLTRLPGYLPPKETPSHDIVSVEEVEVPQNKIPPVGPLTYPLLSAGDQVYIMKISFFGIWVKGKIVEVIVRNPEQSPNYRVRFDTSYRAGLTKVVSGKYLAYSKPSLVRYVVGTRVIALFRNTDAPSKEAYYVGLIAEPPKHFNKFRYLVFFDDGYAQYVPHEKILLVCECSKFVHEDIHPESRDFIKNYLDQYPERPMVKLQQGQIVRTEWNGKWWIARVMEIDGSLAKMYFDADGRTEWIYRGSTRLGPLYSELVAAAARKEQGALSRHRSLGIASLKKRNMPYVEYSVDQDDSKAPSSGTSISKNVAKKSTSSKTNTQECISDKNLGPLTPFEKMEYTSKGYIRSIDLSSRIAGRTFAPHQCGPPCTEWTHYSQADCKGINPLAVPLFFGFERQKVKIKGKRSIMYRAPCGRRLRSMVEVHRYLRITKTVMGLDLFDFDHSVHVLDEFHLERDMYLTHLKDISYGLEKNPVSCVNEIDHSWPSFMDYSTSRIPQEGVNICLDEEFLVCCDCTDDCQNKEKCECWQLTIEGTKLGPEGVADPSVGYQYKRLLEPVTTGIYECNQRCKCSSTCFNRVAQHPLQLNLQVFRTLRKGWGLRTLNDIPQGGFICIYAGRLHTEQSANDDGRMYGDEYLAELDYIEVVERFKEDYESEVIEPGEKTEEDEDDHEEDSEHDTEEKLVNEDDKDYVPEGLKKLPQTQNIVNTRARRKKFSSEEKSESESEKEKEEGENEDENSNMDEDDDEMKKKPSKFTAAVPVDEERPRNYKSVREMFGDGADDCYIMDAKSIGNIGRYLNHSCQPNVFVQNVFVDTHDVRFPWVAFFALTHIKAGTELTWDYNYDVGSVPDKVLYCYCNNAECRGRLL